MRQEDLNKPREIALHVIDAITEALNSGELAVTLVRTNDHKVLPFLVFVNKDTGRISPVAAIVGHDVEEMTKYHPITHEDVEDAEPTAAALAATASDDEFSKFMAAIGAVEISTDAEQKKPKRRTRRKKEQDED